MDSKAMELRNTYQREWKEKNKEQLAAYLKDWRKNNKDKVKQYNQNYWEKKAQKEVDIA